MLLDLGLAPQKTTPRPSENEAFSFIQGWLSMLFII